jgi:alkylated DNA nucleotide flippase Atl1
MSSIKAQIIEIVNKIPKGKVMYFGQVGKLVVNKNQNNDIPNFTGVSGQVVGFVLSGMTQEEWNLLPWQRVVAKDGFISSLKLGAKGLLQKQLLTDEGVTIIEDHVDMSKYLFEENTSEALL